MPVARAGGPGPATPGPGGARDARNRPGGTAMDAPATFSAAAPAPGRQGASLRTWVAVFGCLLGALIAVLDIQITNASLP